MQELVRLGDGSTVAVHPETGEVIGEVLEGEVVEGAEERTWEERVEAFLLRERNVLEERFENAREVAEVGIVWGEGSVEEFAREVGISRTTAYAYRSVWREFGGTDLSERPDNIYWGHYELAVRAENPLAALDHAADEGYTTRQFEEYLSGGFELSGSVSRYTDEGLPDPAYEREEAERTAHRESEYVPPEERTPCPHCSGRGYLTS